MDERKFDPLGFDPHEFELSERDRIEIRGEFETATPLADILQNVDERPEGILEDLLSVLRQLRGEFPTGTTVWWTNPSAILNEGVFACAIVDEPDDYIETCYQLSSDEKVALPDDFEIEEVPRPPAGPSSDRCSVEIKHEFETWKVDCSALDSTKDSVCRELFIDAEVYSTTDPSGIEVLTVDDGDESFTVPFEKIDRSPTLSELEDISVLEVSFEGNRLVIKESEYPREVFR
jgi:hypothetical protein